MSTHVGRTMVVIPAARPGAMYRGAVDLGPILGIVEAWQGMDRDCPEGQLVEVFYDDGYYLISRWTEAQPT